MTDKELTLLAANAAGVLPKDTEDRYDCWEETPEADANARTAQSAELSD